MSDTHQGSLWSLFFRPDQPPKSTRGALDTSRVDVDSDEARELHALLESKLGVVDLVITDNRRRMISAKDKGRRKELRVHHMFLDCDDHTVNAIAGLVQGERKSREIIREYIRENTHQISNEVELYPHGEFHDLEVLLEQSRMRFDDETLDDIAITWSRRGRGKRSIRLGSYDFTRRLVRIHPALDESFVPAFFVEFVIYHELLHAVFPPRMRTVRRVVHTEEFRRMERKHPRFEDAIAWEKENIHRLLASSE